LYPGAGFNFLAFSKEGLALFGLIFDYRGLGGRIFKHTRTTHFKAKWKRGPGGQGRGIHIPKGGTKFTKKNKKKTHVGPPGPNKAQLVLAQRTELV